METPRWARCATALFQLPPKALRMQSAPTRCALARRNSIVFSAFRIMFSAKYAAGAACPGAFVSAITLLLDFARRTDFDLGRLSVLNLFVGNAETDVGTKGFPSRHSRKHARKSLLWFFIPCDIGAAMGC
jgi:hypothetical protein